MLSFFLFQLASYPLASVYQLSLYWPNIAQRTGSLSFQSFQAANVDLKVAFNFLDKTHSGSCSKVLMFHPNRSKSSKSKRYLHWQDLQKQRERSGLSEQFTTTSDVPQRCVVAPNLFNVAVNFWLSRTLEWYYDRKADFHERFSELYYADDVILDILEENFKEEWYLLGLTINLTKTNIQLMSDFPQPLPCQIIINSDHFYSSW